MMSSEDDLGPGYVGHRQRLKERFLNAAKADALATLNDYEYLELLLFLAIPRRDVKPLAKALLARFGSLGAVLSAPPDAITALAGESAAIALKTVQAAALLMLREDVMNKPILSSWDRLLDYCHAAMAYGETESFRILFLDKKNRLIADEQQQRGTVDHTPVYPREVVRRALELAASAIIMVHNHPSGDPTPSREDITMTKTIRDVALPLGVGVHDHLVIGRSGHYSFKAHGLL